jgi:uncharacterized protein YprB with RNaseH-like and TPR domain
MNTATLTARLRGIVRSPAPPPATPSDLPPCGRDTHERGIESALGGEWRALPGGRCFVVERRFEPSERYGDSTIGAFSSQIVEGADAARLLGSEAPLPFFFFDLETTGLNGGAGTFAFLLGCGWFDADGAFVVRQYLLTRAAEERAMLQALRTDLTAAGALVSFNGKSFDVPQLEARCALHRLAVQDVTGRYHLDVLHAARRFWGGSDAAGSCSLASLEEDVLRVHRVNDVAGPEIPWRYFQFIRSGECRTLGPVLEHNRLDLLSLAGVTARLLHLAAGGPSKTDDARELIGLGRAYASAGHHLEAEAAFQRAVEAGRGSPLGFEAHRLLAVGARRARRFGEAAAHWQVLLDSRGCPERIVCEASQALAVHHEHRARDLALAKAYAVRTLQAGSRPAWAEAARYRLARLDRKIAAAGTPLLECSGE